LRRVRSTVQGVAQLSALDSFAVEGTSTVFVAGTDNTHIAVAGTYEQSIDFGNGIGKVTTSGGAFYLTIIDVLPPE